MKIRFFIFLFCLSLSHLQAQDSTIVLNTGMFSDDGQINLSASPGWIYHPGHNPAWASVDLNTTDWVNRAPSTLTVKDADRNGRVEGWFRLRVRLDSTFTGLPVWLKKSTWVAANLYVDGDLLASYGNTGPTDGSYRDHYPINQSTTPVKLVPRQDHLIALHLVEYRSPFASDQLKSQSEKYTSLDQVFRLVGPAYQEVVESYYRVWPLAGTIWMTMSLLMMLFFWLLASQKLGDNQIFRLLAIQSSLTVPTGLGYLVEILSPSYAVTVAYNYVSNLALGMSVAFLPIILLRLVEHPRTRLLSRLLLLVAVGVDMLTNLFPLYTGFYLLFLLSVLIALFYALLSAWKKLRGAQWAIVTGILATFLSSLTYFIVSSTVVSLKQWVFLPLFPGTTFFLALPLSFIIYVALRFKEILAEVREKASAVLRVTEEKRKLLATQNERLEQQVEARTAELKASQAQLIQKEKLASLGELTAGIAHEIQNPLNFVNNFSEVSTELVEELKEGPFGKLPDVEKDYAEEILSDLSSNLKKIHHHGGRAASIVRGMLEHSRTESGEKRPTDLSALADEYLKIAYHGLRAQDKNFNVELETDFAPNLSQVTVSPQEIGRVLLNLYNNAFYAVSERAKQNSNPVYKPTVSVTTRREADQVIIRVRDNGTGIPDAVKAKIFQPFFTTKPTGEGTGLGLSLSYDIVTKGHGGSIDVLTEPGNFTEFTITLPFI